MKESIKPFVLSEDTYPLMERWARQTSINLPNRGYFSGITEDLSGVLKDVFPAVETVSAYDLTRRLTDMVCRSALPVITLDDAYVRSGAIDQIDPTRTVNDQLESTGLGSRRPWSTIEKQIQNSIVGLRNRQIETIALADDVVFFGDTIFSIATVYENAGIRVPKVIAGIAIEAGVQSLADKGIEVEAAYIFPDVIDEICERDFMVGVPNSGRTYIKNQSVRLGVPYIKPFGKPVEWASIPEDRATDFSLFCLSLAIQMWSRIEKETQSNIPTGKMPRQTLGLTDSSSVTTALRRSFTQLSQGDR